MPHIPALLRVARRLTLDGAWAEDLVQQTMLLAWRGFRQLKPDTNARAWLFRILLNAFRGDVRKASRVAEPLQDSSVRPALQESMEVSEALQALPIEQRSVLLLFAVEGFTSREIAGILDVPIGTVMSRLSRAREELRKHLAPLGKAAFR